MACRLFLTAHPGLLLMPLLSLLLLEGIYHVSLLLLHRGRPSPRGLAAQHWQHAA